MFSLVQDSCQIRKCLNGGNCSELNSTHAECQCKTGFYGPNCEEDINECLTIQPCLNNGICTNKPGNFECKIEKNSTRILRF